jgi:flagellar basal-body rod protein FlgB
MIGELTGGGAMPALELTMRFAGARHRLIAHNIANISTPDFRPTDVSVTDFQRVLGEAIDRRRAGDGRAGAGSAAGDLMWKETRELRRGTSGGLELRPATPSSGVLYHDRNNRDTERLMQDLVENATVFRVASDLLKSRYQMLNTAIGERV